MEEEFKRPDDISTKDYQIRKEPGINDLKIDSKEVDGTVEVGPTGTTTIGTETFNTIEFVINGQTYTLLTK